MHPVRLPRKNSEAAARLVWANVALEGKKEKVPKNHIT